ncbi:flagellar basal body-associated protein FliL [Cochlodiniinecator piscidefendens]|uniref:flagellar basal body-associated protein FliL n=1 Tax=Cochlodiniinecator piscidefendens TaxID=2715756 RepID=UPI00140C0C35|nr:flagellar basal body-associated protein FliL [Cochlodiniinecator piscidefendens]
MGKIFPILLALIGTGAGVGAGIFLKPESEEVVQINPCGPGDEGHVVAHEEPESENVDNATVEYIRLSNQFVVPVIEEGHVAALVVMALSLEIEPGNSETVFSHEPKLRDAFLQVLFDHANAGGFEGAFTGASKMLLLRNALSEVARRELGPMALSVLIHDINRQDA